MARAPTPDPRLLADYPLVFDGYNRAALTAEQMTTTRRGRVSAINLAVINPDARLAQALIQIDQAWRTVDALRGVAAIVTSVGGIEAAHRTDRIGIVLSAQSSLMFETDLAHVGVFARLGLRVVQPTAYEKSAFGYGALVQGRRDRGITARGRDWVAAVEAERLLIDLSDCGHRTTTEFIAASTRPLVCSHANAFARCPSPTNKTDAHVRAIAERGGLVGAVMDARALAHAQRPTLDDYLDHVEHLINVGGIDHVGFASAVAERVAISAADWKRNWGRDGRFAGLIGSCGDWYGYEARHNLHYDSLAHTPRIWDGLRRRGLPARSIEKIMGGNWLRVLREVWGD